MFKNFTYEAIHKFYGNIFEECGGYVYKRILKNLTQNSPHFDLFEYGEIFLAMRL